MSNSKNNFPLQKHISLIPSSPPIILRLISRSIFIFITQVFIPLSLSNSLRQLPLHSMRMILPISLLKSLQYFIWCRRIACITHPLVPVSVSCYFIGYFVVVWGCRRFYKWWLLLYVVYCWWALHVILNVVSCWRVLSVSELIWTQTYIIGNLIFVLFFF